MAVPNVGQAVSAIYTALSGDNTLTNLLGTYSSSTCIFEGRLVPSKAPRPYVSIRPLKGFQAWDSKNFTGAMLEFDIACFTDEVETTQLLEQIYSRIINILHRNTLTMTDDNVFLELTNSTAAPSDDSVSGMILTFTLILV